MESESTSEKSSPNLRPAAAPYGASTETFVPGFTWYNGQLFHNSHLPQGVVEQRDPTVKYEEPQVRGARRITTTIGTPVLGAHGADPELQVSARNFMMSPA